MRPGCDAGEFTALGRKLPRVFRAGCAGLRGANRRWAVTGCRVPDVARCTFDNKITNRASGFKRIPVNKLLPVDSSRIKAFSRIKSN